MSVIFLETLLLFFLFGGAMNPYDRIGQRAMITLHVRTCGSDNYVLFSFQFFIIMNPSPLVTITIVWQYSLD